MPETSLTGPTLAELKRLLTIKKSSMTSLIHFFTTTTSKDVSIAYSEIIKKLNDIAEVKKAIDEQKLTSEIVNKFFEGSKPQDITTTLSYIDRHIKDHVRRGINNLLASFFFNWEAGRMMMHTKIGANYHDIYNDIFGVKEKVKIPHEFIRNIVYTIAIGTRDWIRDTNLTSTCILKTKQFEFRNLLISFFVNNELNRLMAPIVIKANYLDIYNDIVRLKENFEKVKIPRDDIIINNIMYTVKHVTMDWIRDVYTTFTFVFMEVVKFIYGIYRLT